MNINPEALYQYAVRHEITLEAAKKRIIRETEKRDEAVRKMLAKKAKKAAA